MSDRHCAFRPGTHHAALAEQQWRSLDGVYSCPSFGDVFCYVAATHWVVPLTAARLRRTRARGSGRPSSAVNGSNVRCALDHLRLQVKARPGATKMYSAVTCDMFRIVRSCQSPIAVSCEALMFAAGMGVTARTNWHAPPPTLLSRFDDVICRCYLGLGLMSRRNGRKLHPRQVAPAALDNVVG